MRQATNSSFNEGLLMDMNPLVTPQTCLTDCLNGTLITYNGNEFTLQNDMGNVKIAKSEISQGYVPLGMKEYGGIIYLALYNPELDKCEIGSIPSPSYDASPNDNYLDTTNLNSSELKLINQNADKSYEFSQKLIKLFEFEQLTLNPGDEYVILYTINGNTLDIFNTETKPIYSIDLYAIDKDSKQHKLDDPNIINKAISQRSDFKFFDHTLSSILALKVSINNINWFEATVQEVSLTNEPKKIKFNFFGKNKLQQSGNTADDLYLRGCKLEFTDKLLNNRTIYLGGGTATDSFKGYFEIPLESIGLNEGDMVDFSITPYDQYTYLHNLKRKLSLTVGQKFEPGAGNNIFKYKYSSENKSLRLDFDLPSNMKNPYMYVEFYDIWSDYSVIIPVEDINPIGVNTLFINTVNEPTVSEYNTTQGGVNKSLLSQYDINQQTGSKKIYRPFMSTTIRKNNLLRENNMYLVRMAVIDKDEMSSDTANISEYMNKYRFLIVNENYNELYDQINNSEITMDTDFNKYNFNNKVSATMNNSLSLVSKGDITSSVEGGFQLTTQLNGKTYYYKYVDTEISVPDIEKQVENFVKTDKYSLTSSVKSITNSFGKVTLTGYDIKSYDYSPVIKDMDSSVKSNSTLTITDKQLSFNLNTNREISAYTAKEIKALAVKSQTDSILDKFYARNNNLDPGLYLQGRKTSLYPRDIFDYANNTQVNDLDSGWDGVAGKALKQAFETKGISGAALNTIGSYKNPDGHRASFALKLISSGELINKEWFLVFYQPNGDGIGVLYNTKSAVLDILKDLKSSIVEEGLRYLYYYTNVEYDAISKTELKGTIELTLTANLQIIQNVNKTESSSNADFITRLDELMKSRGVNTEITETTYFEIGNISQEIKTILDIPYMNIEKGSSNDLRIGLVDGKNDMIQNHPEISNPTSIKNKSVYSESGTYDAIAKKFSVTYDGNNPKFYYNPQNLQHAKWMVGGSGSKNDGNAFDIDINPFDIY